MKTLNICAATVFVLVFLLKTVGLGLYNITFAALAALLFTVPLYITGLVVRWFVRGLVK